MWILFLVISVGLLGFGLERLGIRWPRRLAPPSGRAGRPAVTRPLRPATSPPAPTRCDETVYLRQIGTLLDQHRQASVTVARSHRHEGVTNPVARSAPRRGQHDNGRGR